MFSRKKLHVQKKKNVDRYENYTRHLAEPPCFLLYPTFKGAQVQDFDRLDSCYFVNHRAFLGRRLWGRNKIYIFFTFGTDYMPFFVFVSALEAYAKNLLPYAYCRLR
jgi:hypothetical protein